MESLPLDLRAACLRGLPARELCRVAAVSRAVQAAAMDEGLWQEACAALWPVSNLGSLITTHRECYRCANGWLYLARLPRAVMNVEPTSDRPSRRGTRSQQEPRRITSFDSDDELTVFATVGGAAPVITLRGHSSVEDSLLESPGGSGVVRHLQLARTNGPSDARMLIGTVPTWSSLFANDAAWQQPCGVYAMRGDYSVVPLWELASSRSDMFDPLLECGLLAPNLLMVSTRMHLMRRDLAASVTLQEREGQPAPTATA